MKNCTWIRLLIMVSLLLSNAITHAEGECPPGMFPTNPPGTQGPVGCAPIPGYQQQQAPQAPPPQWASRWGAIATDDSPEHGSTGASVNQPTRTFAEQAALENCRSNGGANCEIKGAYDNACIAMAVGNPGYQINTGVDQNAATQAAMLSCSSHGNTKCHTYYTACSLPVRIQ